VKLRRSLRNAILWSAVLLVVVVQNAHAYVDPGTGSYIVQLILAGLLGAAVAVRIYWKKIKASIRNLASRGDTEQDVDE
jgi:hypothetical protein